MLLSYLLGLIQSVFTELGVSSSIVKFQRPPNPQWGDLSMNCSHFAKEGGISIEAMLSALIKSLNADAMVEKVSSIGAFINITLKLQHLFADACRIAREKKVVVGKMERVMVEYISPNTNKPLHLGHLRNGVIGSAVSNILESVGHDVVRAILVNDKGVHICKSMLAYMKWGNGSTPESFGMKGDHFVGHWYVEYAKALKENPDLEQETNQMLLLWENGDKETRELWEKMNAWVYDGFSQTYESFGFRFDKSYYESELYMEGKEIVMEGVKNSTFKYKNDAVVFELDEKEFGLNPDQTAKSALLIRADGTSVYLTQDISTAARKATEFNLDHSVYVVGSEQEHHFKVLFSILRALGYSWASNCYHMSYGMVELPEGKMKSREGTVVDADELLVHMSETAREIMVDRNKTSFDEDTVKKISRTLSLAAIKFYLLRFSPKAKIKFDPKESLSFTGDTGAYCLYAYVRSQSLLKKATSANFACENFSRLGTTEERVLALNIIQLPEVIKMSALRYDPSFLAEHILKLAHSFHNYYGKERIICEDRNLSNERLALVNAFAESMKWGLSLLGIDVLDEM